jgi:hypothetical protein
MPSIERGSSGLNRRIRDSSNICPLPANEPLSGEYPQLRELCELLALLLSFIWPPFDASDATCLADRRGRQLAAPKRNDSGALPDRRATRPHQNPGHYSSMRRRHLRGRTPDQQDLVGGRRKPPDTHGPPRIPAPARRRADHVHPAKAPQLGQRFRTADLPNTARWLGQVRKLTGRRGACGPGPVPWAMSQSRGSMARPG